MAVRASKKSSKLKTLMEFFQKFSILTENLVDFDVTCSVILGTVQRVPQPNLQYGNAIFGRMGSSMQL